MDYKIFISYPTPNQDLVENFADHLDRNGVKAWVYSIDKTLSGDTWREIETRIDKATIFAFIASVHSRDAGGQHRELLRAVEKVQECFGGEFRFLPIVIGDFPFNELPTVLKQVNGVRLDGHTVASTAHTLARTFFSDLFDDAGDKAWHCPKSGQWLEVHHIDPGIERYLTPKDLLYFRRLSPMGLFECYSPKLKGLFWILPENVRACGNSQDEFPRVPWEFRCEANIEYEILGRKHSKSERSTHRI